MKLRQKLAVVLASAMVVTAVPVVTMAASTTGISKKVTVAEDTVLVAPGQTGVVAPELSIKLQHGFTTSQSFYLALENAKWNADTEVEVTNKAGERVGYLRADEDAKDATVSFDFEAGATLETDDTLRISLAGVKVTGEAKVTVDAEGTEIDNATLVFANKSDSEATVTAKDAKTFYTTTTAGEEVGTIVITEAVVGSFAGDAADRTITIDLEHGDYEFLNDTLTVTGKRGFTGINGAESVTLNADKDRLTVVLKSTAAASQVGTFEISGIKVKSTDKAPETGDLEVTVEGKNDTKVASTTVKVATVAEYGTGLTVAEKKEITSGKDAKVKITYKETTKDSIGRSDIDFVLNQGYVDYSTVTNKITVSTSGPVTALSPIYEDKDAEKAADQDKIIGFTITTKGDDTKLEKYIDGKEITIRTELDMTGEITFTTSGRYVEEQTVVVAEAKPNFTVKAEAMTLKVGQSKQVGGKFVITEDKAGALDKSSVITLELPTEDGISFTELPEVTVDGAKAKIEWKNKTSKSAINITLTKSSKETPATITVEGLEVKVDRTVAQGTYDLKLSINDYEGTLKSKDFFVVGTPNTEELAANGLPKGTATFTIGSANYTVNGKEATMDASAYIQDPGYTMVPVRYVATAFGVNAQDILFSNSTATIFAGSRTIQLTAGSDVAIVNGASVKLSTKVVVKDGRTYAPVGEIARILGISANWDATNKVATFENK